MTPAELAAALDSLTTMASPERWRQCRSPIIALIDDLESEAAKWKARALKEREAVEALEKERERRHAPMPVDSGPSIPWAIIEPHEQQAQKNHDQSLQTLYDRGGLSAGEALCIMGGVRWGTIPEAGAAEKLQLLIDQRTGLLDAARERDALKATVEALEKRAIEAEAKLAVLVEAIRESGDSVHSMTTYDGDKHTPDCSGCAVEKLLANIPAETLRYQREHELQSKVVEKARKFANAPDATACWICHSGLGGTPNIPRHPHPERICAANDVTLALADLDALKETP